MNWMNVGLQLRFSTWRAHSTATQIFFMRQARPSDIPSACSKLALLKHGDHIMLVHNARGDAGGDGFSQRQNLSLWVSDDGLRSFDKRVPLTREGVVMFYPHAFVDEGRGSVYIACENARQSYCLRIPFAQLWDE